MQIFNKEGGISVEEETTNICLLPYCEGLEKKQGNERRSEDNKNNKKKSNMGKVHVYYE